MNNVILEMKNISKTFGGVHALNDVNLKVYKGEMHALIGENGAGKSTLMKILLGMYRCDSGDIIYKGKHVNYSSPAAALKNGISMIHQEISLLPDMSVAENIWFGREKNFTSAGFWLKTNERLIKTKELLDSLNIDIDPRALVRKLSVAQMQLVELARAISYEPSIIIMDEPTSALSDNEVALLYSIVRGIAKKGVTIIFISHKLEEIYEICENISVLRDGHLIKSCAITALPKNELINLIVGRKVEKLFERSEVKPGKIVLEVKNLSRFGICRNINFSVRSGEILGICGLMGAGRSEVLRAVFGIDKKTTGQIVLEGEEIKICSPYDAVRKGMAMVTEDRLRQGVIGVFSVMQNMTLANFFRICNRIGFFKPKREIEIFNKTSKELAVKYGSFKAPIGSLSGGNQQKVIIGRWLLTKPKVFLLDEPTRGIDVGSKSEIYKMIDDLTKKGIAVVMVSSELPEILSLSDRIIVMRDGEIVHECKCAQATQESLMEYAFGIKR